MQNSKKDDGVVICIMSGVLLVRYGPASGKTTRYEVVEPDHVAGFSHAHFEYPLNWAVQFFLERANWRQFWLRGFPD